MTLIGISPFAPHVAAAVGDFPVDPLTHIDFTDSSGITDASSDPIADGVEIREVVDKAPTPLATWTSQSVTSSDNVGPIWQENAGENSLSYGEYTTRDTMRSGAMSADVDAVTILLMFDHFSTRTQRMSYHIETLSGTSFVALSNTVMNLNQGASANSSGTNMTTTGDPFTIVFACLNKTSSFVHVRQPSVPTVADTTGMNAGTNAAIKQDQWFQIGNTLGGLEVEGNIYEAVYWDSALSEADMNTIGNNYIADKYSISWTDI